MDGPDVARLERGAGRGERTEAARRALETWLAGRLVAAEEVALAPLASPGESGFSSETRFLRATWRERGARRSGRYVLRSRPHGDTVFPEYDLDRQVRCMEIARARGVPTPRVLWVEPDERWLGAPFYVMEAVEGAIPTDNPPYTVKGFLFEASPAQRAQAYRSALDALARLHAIEPSSADLAFLDRGRFGAPGLDQEVGAYTHLLGWMAQGRPQPTLEAALARLLAPRPDPGPNVLCWGDARLGNIVFRDFEPVALLDWEMASLAPREQDVGWFLFFLRFFSDALGVPNLAGFPSDAEGIAHYEARAGVRLRDMDWWIRWAAFRHGIVMARIAGIERRRGRDVPGLTETDNFASRLLARLMDLPAPT